VIAVPESPGQMILDEVAMRLSPLMTCDKFIRFVKERGLAVSHEQLHVFEKHRALVPVVRIGRSFPEDHTLRLDGSPTAPDFEAGWVVDTSAPGGTYVLPEIDGRDCRAFYSAYQLWALERVLQGTTSLLDLGAHVGTDAESVDWDAYMSRLVAQTAKNVDRLRSDPSLCAVPLLCQLISNRYLPLAQGNQRTIRIGGRTQFGGWMTFSSESWDWQTYRDDWDPARLIPAFALDEESLERIYVNLVNAMRLCDPLWSWAELVRFVNQRKRDELKGDALRAESYRQGAEMVRQLHLELYGVDLGPPEEMFGQVINYIPELEVRDDPRLYLQYVTNQYDLNSQPKAVLFVEGETEVVFVKKIFLELFGQHHGKSGIEIIDLAGVDNATGTKKEDRYGAIFRLVDYLHDHQTFAFIMLDQENRAKKLWNAAANKSSSFLLRSRVMPQDQICLWRQDFELDNFSDTEIARALTDMPGHSVRFRSTDIKAVRSQWRNRKISGLFRERTGRDLKKPLLAERLAEIVVAPETRRRPANRPVIKFLQRVDRQSWMNPLPITRDIWRQNQEYLDRH